jgi:hypothetical protein
MSEITVMYISLTYQMPAPHATLKARPQVVGATKAPEIRPWQWLNPVPTWHVCVDNEYCRSAEQSILFLQEQINNHHHLINLSFRSVSPMPSCPRARCDAKGARRRDAALRLDLIPILKVHMELGSYFLFLQEQIKDIIINPKPETLLAYEFGCVCI